MNHSRLPFHYATKQIGQSSEITGLFVKSSKIFEENEMFKIKLTLLHEDGNGMILYSWLQNNFLGIVDVSLRAREKKNLPKFSIPIYSIVFCSGLVTTGESTAVISLENQCKIAFWEHCALEAAIFTLNNRLRISHKSFFNPRSEIRSFEFAPEKVENLLRIATCGTIASLTNYITNEQHRHCKIKVLVKKCHFNVFIFKFNKNIRPVLYQ